MYDFNIYFIFLHITSLACLSFATSIKMWRTNLIGFIVILGIFLDSTIYYFDKENNINTDTLHYILLICLLMFICFYNFYKHYKQYKGD